MSSVAEILGLPVCEFCNKPAPYPEHLYERGDERWVCLPCIVLNYGEAERAVMEEQMRRMKEREP